MKTAAIGGACLALVCSGIAGCDGSDGSECASEGGWRRTCGRACVDSSSDPAHCGACDRPCETGVCRLGGCCLRLARRADELDLLFVIDNSGSVWEQQASLAEQLPRMVTALGTGDLDSDGERDFEPPRSVHVGVVTSDMGVGGFDIPTCEEAELGDDAILLDAGDLSIPGCVPGDYSFLDYRPGYDPVAFAEDLGCMVRAGRDGCGWEQPLEAALKAVTPSTSPTRFAMDTTGHADGANVGFMRQDAVLAVVLLTDEDDCSVADPELFDPSSGTYEGGLNLRCFDHPAAAHPVARYVDGLLAVKEQPGQLVYAVIAGVPADLAAEGVGNEEILADDRMQQVLDDADPDRLRSSCTKPDGTVAYPPRRMVEVARGLRDRGAQTTVQSICEADLAPAVDAVLRALADVDVSLSDGLLCPL